MLIPHTLVVSEESYQQDGTGPGTGVQLTGRHAARDDASSVASVADDAVSAGGRRAASPVPAARTG